MVSAVAGDRGRTDELVVNHILGGDPVRGVPRPRTEGSIDERE
jgi:hypothetical protein